MKKIIKYIGLSVLLGASLTSCDNGFEEVNVDPNNPTNVPVGGLLTQSEQTLFSILEGRTLNAEWGMLMTQQWSQNEYCEESRYEVDGNTFNGVFNGLYAGTLKDLDGAKLIVEASTTITEAERANQNGILDILSALTYQSLSDGFGAIPYSQALNAVEYPNPAYDSQAEIYADILMKLESAVASLDVSAGSFKSGDNVYGGDVAKWKKLGNSLLLRAAMRVADVDPALSKKYVQSAASDLITSNYDNALYVFDANPDVANPLWIDVNTNNRDDFCASDLLIKELEGSSDPRIAKYAAMTSAGAYVGMPYGLDDNTASGLKGTTSRPADDVRGATTPYVIMDAAQVNFLLAEAYQRGFLSGDASSAFKTAIEQSLNFWGVDSGSASAYLASVSYDASNWKKSIGEQKWLALYANGYEAWSEWRRLDYPSLSAPAAAALKTIPVRLPYPIDEQTNNKANLGEVTSTPEDLTTKLWWDVN